MKAKGAAASAVPEHVGAAIGAIVFLDAFLPDDGQKGLDLNSPQSRAALLEAIKRGKISRPPTTSTSERMSAADHAWLTAKATRSRSGCRSTRSSSPARVTHRQKGLHPRPRLS